MGDCDPLDTLDTLDVCDPHHPASPGIRACRSGALSTVKGEGSCTTIPCSMIAVRLICRDLDSLTRPELPCHVRVPAPINPKLEKFDGTISYRFRQTWRGNEVQRCERPPAIGCTGIAQGNQRRRCEEERSDKGRHCRSDRKGRDRCSNGKRLHPGRTRDPGQAFERRSDSSRGNTSDY